MHMTTYMTQNLTQSKLFCSSRCMASAQSLETLRHLPTRITCPGQGEPTPPSHDWTLPPVKANNRSRKQHPKQAKSASRAAGRPRKVKLKNCIQVDYASHMAIAKRQEHPPRRSKNHPQRTSSGKQRNLTRMRC